MMNHTEPGYAPDNILPSAGEISIPDTVPSWQSRCMNVLLRLLPIKRRMASAAAVQEQVRKLTASPASHAPTGLDSDVEVILKQVGGWPVYYTAPVTNADNNHYVVFLHGGGYISEIVSAHWRFIDYLTHKASVRCIVPIYPLAPKGTAKDIVPATGELLRKLLEDVGAAKVTVIGNSVGAGLGLAAAQWLRDSGYRQPDKLVLISPALTASIGQPERQEIAARDPLLAIPGLLEGMRLYAGDLDITHPYISPLNGDLHELSPMIIFSGTLDLLYPDSIALTVKARTAGVPVELHLQREQVHNYALMPTPEGRQARALIVRAVTQA